MASTFHTIVISDIHLADAEPPHPKNPLWKRYKRRKLFIDRSFERFLEYIQSQAEGQIELVLNGDVFDFDSVLAMPDSSEFTVSWLERKRGFFAEEAKSKFKISLILRDHDVFVRALRNFIMRGNRVVFVIGNHDMELHWPSVREEIQNHLDLPGDKKEFVRFCEWFYVANRDTVIEHGNQYDPYSVCADPIHPLIRKGKRYFVRLPFGNLANKFMLNGMGLFNPHVDGSFIKETFFEYVVFFYKYVVRVQPGLAWTWFWGAITTLIYSIGEGLLPALMDPLTTERKVVEIAKRANTTPATVRSLKMLAVHPGYFKPFKILRELWLDRALILGAILFGSFWFFSTLNVFVNVSYWWFLIPVILTFPMFIFYAQSVESNVSSYERRSDSKLVLAAKIAKVRRVVYGHTHRERFIECDGVELMNTGTWSAAYLDPECTQPIGKKCFAWIRPGASGGSRVAELHEWLDPGTKKLEKPHAFIGNAESHPASHLPASILER